MIRSNGKIILSTSSQTMNEQRRKNKNVKRSKFF